MDMMQFLYYLLIWISKNQSLAQIKVLVAMLHDVFTPKWECVYLFEFSRIYSFSTCKVFASIDLSVL